MSIKHMRIFLSVLHHNSVSKAAKALHLTQPAVSRAIIELENYYQILLFDRLAKRLYVTKKGLQFAQYATTIVEVFDQMEANIQKDAQKENLRIGTSITIGNFLLPKFVSNIKEVLPYSELEIRINNSASIQKALLQNTLDVGLIEGPILYNELVALPFMHDRLVLITPLNHPLLKSENLKLKDIIKYDLLLREKGSAGREILDSIFLLHNIEIKPSWESVSTQAIIKAVIRGLGISILPYLLVKEFLDTKQIETKELNDISLERDYTFIYHKDKYLNNTAQTLLALCKEATL